MTAPPLIIYHANCVDGFASAWAAREYFKIQGVEPEFVAAGYGDKPPGLLPARNIFIVDYSYPKPVLDELGTRSNVVIVLDHHKTAAADLTGYPLPMPIKDYEFVLSNEVSSLFPHPVYAEFDMERSGAGMTWDYFFPMVRRPALIESVEDRDLWRFKYKDTRAIHASLASYPMDFAIWDELAQKMESPYRRGFIVAEGEAIDRRHLQVVRETMKAGMKRMIIGGHNVPACNAPFAMASDMGNIMCTDGTQPEPFSATYFDRADGKRQFSLRSTNAGIDVSEIAKKYGGGGHRNASGFTAAGNWEGDVL